MALFNLHQYKGVTKERRTVICAGRRFCASEIDSLSHFLTNTSQHFAIREHISELQLLYVYNCQCMRLGEL